MVFCHETNGCQDDEAQDKFLTVLLQALAVTSESGKRHLTRTDCCHEVRSLVHHAVSTQTAGGCCL